MNKDLQTLITDLVIASVALQRYIDYGHGETGQIAILYDDLFAQVCSITDHVTHLKEIKTAIMQEEQK
jgi:hypothetical protein